MKKVYKRPQVYIERMELSAHIASCTWDYQNDTNPENCYALGKIEGADNLEVALFTTANANCIVDSAYCDFTPDGVSATFNS